MFAPLDYEVGKPLYLCPNCLARGNADVNASRNIGLKLLHRYHLLDNQKKPVEKPAGVLIPQDAAWPTKRRGDGDGPALPLVPASQLRSFGRSYAAKTG